ncbi:MAG: WxL domain-containing protein [Kurthia sp.]|nr:WxL domain-containing protein [Candidatus Kurthia equi]
MQSVTGLTSSIILISLLIPIDASDVQAKSKTSQTNGTITLEASTEREHPVYPLQPNPEKPVIPDTGGDSKPGTTGPLSIDYISDFQFGNQYISTKNQTYYALPQKYNSGEKPTANYVQITDKRGTSAGWRLTVEQKTAFLASSAQSYNSEIKGAELRIFANEGVILSNGSSKKPTGRNVKLTGAGSSESLVAAEQGKGEGLWTITLGNLEEKNSILVNSGVMLEIPGSSQVDVDEYKCNLIWKLENVPGFL